MKKVLFVATVTSHINAFHIPYLRWFKEQGYEVHVASKGNDKIEYCDKHYDIKFERNPLKPNNLKAYKELRKIINSNEYKIIHCHTPVGGVLTRLAARKARKKGTKVIYTAHGFHFYKGAPLLNWIIYYPIEKICARWTDCLITINKEDYELAKKKFKKANKIELVHGVGFDATKFDKKLTAIEKKNKKNELGIKDGDIVFTYVAEINKNKNQIFLINVIKKIKKDFSNVKLLLVGTGDRVDFYNGIIKNEHLEDNVKLIGRRNDINDILSITDIYLASSIREGLGLNIIEAMYKKIPIVAIDNRGHRELITNNENGFIVRTTEEMYEAINKILLNDELKIQFIENSNKKINKFLLKDVMKKMSKLYIAEELRGKANV